MKLPFPKELTCKVMIIKDSVGFADCEKARFCFSDRLIFGLFFFRIGQKQDYTAANVGFRCAKSAPEFDPKPGAKLDPSTQGKNRKKKRVFHTKRDEL